MKKDGGLRDIFRERLPAVHFQSIETGLLGRGIPDANGCAPVAPCSACGRTGVSFWIEFKFTDAWAVGLEPEQVAWLTRRARAGGGVFVAVRRRFPASTRKTATDELWLLRGADAREIKDHGLRAAGACLGTWSGGPPKWDWPAVLRALTVVG